MASKVSIISSAFINLGKEGVSSPQTDNPIFTAAASIYDQLIPYIFTLGNWRFATKVVELNKIVGDPLPTEWFTQFQIPGDFILLRRVRPLSAFNIFEDRIYSNQDVLQLEYVFLVSEADYPPWFENLCIVMLTARIAMLVTQTGDLAKFWEEMAQKTLQQARATAQSEHPTLSIQPDAILTSHLSSGISYGR